MCVVADEQKLKNPRLALLFILENKELIIE